MQNPNDQDRRIFDEARRKQGFKSQAHLDAFYASLDHQRDCPNCNAKGYGVWLDDGFQPTLGPCDERDRLDKISWSF